MSSVINPQKPVPLNGDAPTVTLPQLSGSQPLVPPGTQHSDDFKVDVREPVPPLSISSSPTAPRLIPPRPESKDCGMIYAVPPVAGGLSGGIGAILGSFSAPAGIYLGSLGIPAGGQVLIGCHSKGFSLGELALATAGNLSLGVGTYFVSSAVLATSGSAAAAGAVAFGMPAAAYGLFALAQSRGPLLYHWLRYG